MPAMPRVVEQKPGRVTLEWDAMSNPAIVGYNVWRLWDRDIGTRTAARINDEPIEGTRFVDDTLAGAGMRRYYIEAVDRLGQQGIYSGGAWAFRKPTPAPTE